MIHVFALVDRPVISVLLHNDKPPCCYVFLQVDLQQNPWECNCEAAPLKRWLEGLSAVVVVGEVVCHSPEKTKGVDLRSISMELLCPELEAQEEQEKEQQQQQEEQTATSTATADRGISAEYPGTGIGPVIPPGKDSIPLSVLVLSLLVLFVSAFFAAAALIAYALRRRDKLPFRRQGEVDLAGIQMECGIFTEQTHHHHHHHHHHPQHQQQHHHHGLPKTPPLPGPEHNHVYDTILPPEAGAKGANCSAAPHLCSSTIYKEDQEKAATQRPQSEGGYCSAADKDRDWTLEVTSSPINTVTGAMGPLVGLHGNGILCPTVIDSQGPTPKVELVDCLFRLPADRYTRPPPRYPHPQDSKQQDSRAGGDPVLVVTTVGSTASAGAGGVGGVGGVGGSSSSSSSQSQQGAAEQQTRLRTTPDYMEVLERSYQF